MADSDITVAVATHKAYRMPIDGVYMPLQVGRALHPNVDLGMTCDNTGDNISQLNAQYSELTGLYWMWKNCDADYQGLVHYRRHFAKNDSAKRHGDENERFSCIAGKQDYARLLDTCEIIVPERRNYYIETVYSHYEHTMQEGQLDATRSIIAQTNSDYLDAFDAQMNKTSAHLFNMFVMRKDLINEYCSWMFPHHRRTGQAYRFKLIQRLRNAISRTHQRNPLRCMAGNQPLPVRRNAYHQPRTSGLDQKGVRFPYGEIRRQKVREKLLKTGLMAVSTQPLISVIVPVYNVERYLDQCVESLIGQTYERLEIILVDDGSTDSSGEQCNAWANRDNRIRAVRQCNAGLAAARNTGLDLAKGEYIGFVDSDDYVLPDMFGTLLHNLQESDADLSIISYERENPDGSTYCNAFPDKKIVMTSQEAFAYVNQHGYFYVTAWDKLAKKELFDNLRYPLDAVYAEDSPVTYQLLDKADRIVYDSTPLYRYRMSENSQSHGITDKFAQSTGAMLDLVRTKYPHVEAYAAYGHLESIVGTCNRIMLAHQRKQWAQFERYARTELRELLPMVERKGIIGKSQLLQWKLLATSPTLYGMMYALYKRRHPEIASH